MDSIISQVSFLGEGKARVILRKLWFPAFIVGIDGDESLSNEKMSTVMIFINI